MYAANQVDRYWTEALRVFRHEIRENANGESQQQAVGGRPSGDLMLSVAENRVFAYAGARFHNVDDHPVLRQLDAGCANDVDVGDGYASVE